MSTLGTCCSQLIPCCWPALYVLTWCERATEMDVTMIGLQNAGKTSLLRVLSVSKSSPTPLELPPADLYVCS